MKNLNTNTSQLITTVDSNHVVTITLNNPRYMNALSEELTPYLRKILKKISKDSKYKLLIIRGQGRAFCSGGNIKKMSKGSIYVKSKTQKQKIMDLEKKQKELTGMIYNLKIPTLAVITGAVAGAGFALALSCDLRIGNKDAFFVSNYSNIGLSGDYGISWFLSNLLGESKSKEIMFLNDRIYYEEALQIGLLNKLINKNFEKELQKITASLSNQSTIALRYIKKNIIMSKNHSLDKAFKYEADHLIKCTYTQEHKNAVANFKKK